MDIRKLVFLAETGAKTNMTRRYGWGPSDQRVTDLVPHGHWETTTLIHAIDCHGTRASMINNGPTNSWVRTERKLYNAIGKAIEAVTPNDYLNCFRNSGYITH